jgi:Ca2+-binding EF-hand superfamily protein
METGSWTMMSSYVWFGYFIQILHVKVEIFKGEMNEFRCGLVMKAFKKLDANKNGVIQVDDIQKFYNARMDPNVVSGKKTEKQALDEYLSIYDSVEKDGVVTYKVEDCYF